MKSLRKDQASCHRGAEILKAVAHPLRLQIVAILAVGEATVTALAARLAVGQAIVSQQLRILRSHRLVAVTREGGFARYRLEEPSLRKMIQCMEGCLAGRARR